MTANAHRPALDHDVLESVNEDGQVSVLVRHQVSRDTYRYSVHVSFHQWSQTTPSRPQFLVTLGFEPCGEQCHFADGGVDAVSREVDSDFDIHDFARRFGPAHTDVVEAERVFGDCGFEDKNRTGGGDGHSGGRQRETRDQSEDDHFQYVMTVFGGDSGWVTHYRLKDANSEVRRVLVWLGLRSFPECPVFEFEECFWSHLELRTSRGFFDTNADAASGAFRAHAENFSEACLRVVNAERQLAPFGLSLLPPGPAG